MSGKSKKKSPIEAIVNNYYELEKSLVAQLNFEVPKHPPTIGGFREEIWKQLFEQIIPKKYVIEQSVFLMDSDGKISREVDLAIFDEMYTPYIFKNGRIKFIPIEAVAAVIQCKSTNVDDKDGAGKYDLETWCESINDLNTSDDSVARMASGFSVGPARTQKKTRPIKVLCALKKPKDELMNKFDFYIIADKNRSPDKLEITIPNEKWDLQKWHIELNMGGKEEKPASGKNRSNSGQSLPSEEEERRKEEKLQKTLSDYRVKSEGKSVSLLTLNFQFNQLLMLINNPMLFPHISYAKMFDEEGGAGKDDEKTPD